MSLFRGILTITILIVATILVFVPLFSMGIIALLLPGRAGVAFRRWMEVWLFIWTGFNRALFKWMRTTEMVVDWQGANDVSTDQWYLIICNHQSWTDILVLQSVLWNRVPQIKFFTKQQLIWVPFVGLGMYVLGFPYVKRATKAQIARNPDLKGADRENIRKTCDRLRYYPSSLLNFVEGTRYTSEKHGRQRAAHRNLLNVKVGGLSYVVAEMGSTLHRMIDITIAYPAGVPTFWEFLQGRCPRIDVHIEALQIPAEIIDQSDEREQRRLLAAWLDHRWRSKDNRIDVMLGRTVGHPATSAT